MAAESRSWPLRRRRLAQRRVRPLHRLPHRLPAPSSSSSSSSARLRMSGRVFLTGFAAAAVGSGAGCRASPAGTASPSEIDHAEADDAVLGGSVAQDGAEINAALEPGGVHGTRGTHGTHGTRGVAPRRPATPALPTNRQSFWAGFITTKNHHFWYLDHGVQDRTLLIREYQKW